MSPQGLRALTNPRVTYGRCFSDDIWVGNDWIFVYYFWVNRGYVHLWIQLSPMEVVSLMISELAATQFSLSISKSIRAVSADKSMRHLWKGFQWWVLSRQRLHFRWLFLNQKGMRALMNPCVTCGSGFVDHFWGGRRFVFIDYFWVNRGWVCWRILASPLEVVSLMISESAPTLFLLMISESAPTLFLLTVVVGVEEATRDLWKWIRLWFLSRQWLIFLLGIYESTRAASANKSTCHL